jgi:hypothetical protein
MTSLICHETRLALDARLYAPGLSFSGPSFSGSESPQAPKGRLSETNPHVNEGRRMLVRFAFAQQCLNPRIRIAQLSTCGGKLQYEQMRPTRAAKATVNDCATITCIP